MGWRELGVTAGRLAQTLGARTLAAERRGATAARAYYWRDRPERVLVLPETPEFDLTSGLNENAAEQILLITDCPFPERLQSFYSTVEAIGRIDTVAGPTSTRSFAVFLLSGHRGPIRPLAPCELGVLPPAISATYRSSGRVNRWPRGSFVRTLRPPASSIWSTGIAGTTGQRASRP